MKLRSKKTPVVNADPEGTQVIPPQSEKTLKELALEAAEKQKNAAAAEQSQFDQRLIAAADKKIHEVLGVTGIQWKIMGRSVTCTLEGVPLRYGPSRHDRTDNLFLNRYADDNCWVSSLAEFGKAIEAIARVPIAVQPGAPSTPTPLPKPKVVGDLQGPEWVDPPKYTRDAILARFEDAD